MFIISGPTGVGKTDLSLKLADKLNLSIVNSDAWQFYKYLNIGTAKPDYKNLKIPHRFFDILDKPESYTSYRYRRDLVNFIKNNNIDFNKILITGGSGFYINSLLFDSDNLNKLSNLIRYKYDNKSILWDRLNKIDPDRAKEINKNDYYRLERSLDIWQNLKIKPSKFKPEFKPINLDLNKKTNTRINLIILVRDRDDLYKRINSRVDEMLSSGWIEEVKNLKNLSNYSSWKEFLLNKKPIGYDIILNCLDSDTNLKNLDSNNINLIKKLTRNYAKKQLIYFRMLSKKLINNKDVDITYLNLSNLTSAAVDLYIKQLLNSN